MDPKDFVLKFYESARAELIQRIVLRDGALIVYITAIGYYMSRVLEAHKHMTELSFITDFVLLVPLPFLCLIFTLIILHHHLVTLNLGNYLGGEWQQRNNVAELRLVHWDMTREATSRVTNTFRTWAQALILFLPLMYDGFFTGAYRAKYASSKLFVFIVLGMDAIAFVVAALIIWLHIWVHIKRTIARSEELAILTEKLAIMRAYTIFHLSVCGLLSMAVLLLLTTETRVVANVSLLIALFLFLIALIFGAMVATRVRKVSDSNELYAQSKLFIGLSYVSLGLGMCALLWGMFEFIYTDKPASHERYSAIV